MYYISWQHKPKQSKAKQTKSKLKLSWSELTVSVEPYAWSGSPLALENRFIYQQKKDEMHKCASSELKRTNTSAITHRTIHQQDERRKKRQRTYALIWFDGWCVKIHGFCFCIWFPSFFPCCFLLIQRSTFGFSLEIIDRMHSVCIHLNVLSKCLKV